MSVVAKVGELLGAGLNCCVVLCCVVMVLSVVFYCVLSCHIMLCCVILCHVVSCCLMLSHVVLCCVMWCCVVLSCFVVLYCVVLCCVMLCCVMFCVVLCCVVLCRVMPCCIVLCCCCAVLCCAVSCQCHVMLCRVTCHNIDSALFQWLYEDDLLQCPMRGNSMITPARATVMADLRKVHQSTYLLPLSISTQPFMKLSLVRYLANSFMWSVYDKDHMSELRIPLEPQNFFWALFVTA